VSLTTAELLVESYNETGDGNHTTEEYVGLSKPRYEILAGCLKVDDDKKVTPGCTTEYMQSGTPISRHCICETHLCNYYNMLQFNSTTISSEMEVHRSSAILNDDDTKPTSSAEYLKPMGLGLVLVLAALVGWRL